MPDQSHLDRRYFIDNYVYNCPFCNRNNVPYTIRAARKFDWSDSLERHAYFVVCRYCDKTSLHLSREEVPTTEIGGVTRFNLDHIRKLDLGREIDDVFFVSIPSSFFTIDDRIPRTIRDLFSEAEGSLRNNFLTGGSACARKVIFELAKLSNATGNDYESRIKSLKQIHADVDETYFDTLLSIHDVTSSKVHENAYDGWTGEHLRLILATLTEVLHAIYVEPAERLRRRMRVVDLSGKLLPKKGVQSAEGSGSPVGSGDDSTPS